jgi:ATP/maltotriose-dependent transcriptional regulator MalT
MKPRLILVKTKVSPPVFNASAVSRDRLVRMISDNLDKKLILVCAGAGHGKTTLLSEFVNKTEHLVAWYHLEPADNSLYTLCLYIIHAVRRVLPTYAQRLLDDSDYYRDLFAHQEYIMGALANELAERRGDGRRICVILDNFEVVRDDLLMAAMDYFIWHLPPHATAVIGSRVRPHLSLAKLEAKNMMFTIDERDLAFNEDEIRLFFEARRGSKLSGHEIKEIKAHTEGWAAGLNIFDKSRLLNRAGWDSEIFFRYFSEEIFVRMSRPFQEFLIKSSVLATLSPPVCDKLLSRSDSREILFELESNHLFVTRLDTQEECFRCHPLFREFLQKKLCEDEHEHKLLCRRIAAHFEAGGSWQKAVEYYVLAEDFEKVATLLEGVDMDSLLFGNGAHWIDRIPAAIFYRHPGLVSRKAEMALMFFRNDEAESLLKSALSGFQECRDLKGMATTKVRLGYVYKRLGKGQEAIAALEDGTNGPLETRDLMMGKAYLGECYQRVGETAKATCLLQEALHLARDIGDTFHEFLISVKLEVDLGVRVVPKREFTPDQFGTTCEKLKFYEFQGMRDFRSGELGKAFDSFGSLEKLLAAHHFPNLQSALWGKGLVRLHQLRLTEARRYLRKALDLSRHYGDVYIAEGCIDTLIDVLFFQRRWEEARALSGRQLETCRNAHCRIPAKIILARMAIEEGNFDAAKKLLSEAALIVKQLSAGFTHNVMIGLARAKLAFTQGDRAQAKTFLAQALHGAREEGLNCLIIREYLWDRKLFDLARENGIESEYLDFIESRIDVLGPVVRADVLGPLRFFVDGDEIPAAAWKSNRSKAILTYCMVQPRLRLPREKLMDLFWHEADSTTSAKNFRPSLSYIRKALNWNAELTGARIEPILYRDKLYSLNPDLRFETDVAAFKRLIEEGREVEPSNPPLAIEKYEAAVSLYRGDFLEEFYYPWAEEYRVCYRDLYHQVLCAVAKLQAEMKNWRKAIEYLTRSLSIDELQENVHLEIIKCYLGMGMRKSALDHYRRMEKTMKQLLNARPSPEAEAVLHLIRK